MSAMDSRIMVLHMRCMGLKRIAQKGNRKP